VLHLGLHLLLRDALVSVSLFSPFQPKGGEPPRITMPAKLIDGPLGNGLGAPSQEKVAPSQEPN
jgi:hypothetical protein